ncbi:hypothetical protein CLV99_4474 [Sphingobacterium yanglingense]|uniref:Uncharacterized protein n=2 Tax=Sphingobacterium yanglingense TaxID=1437280 RepID=A0A4R6W838_9SPHI|nr:hypothetical protein CLV99_4474 [Sphingobacterium yanglingense]
MTSCGLGEKSYPEQVFDKVAVAANKVPNGFKVHFREIRGQLKAGSLVIVTPENEVKKVNATEYVTNHYVAMFEKDMLAIKEMKTDEETKPIFAATLDLFQYVDNIYKTDMLRIAKMIDEGQPNEDIDTAIDELEASKSKLIDERFNKVYDLIMPYADKHGVDYKIMDTPNFSK